LATEYGRKRDPKAIKYTNIFHFKTLQKLPKYGLLVLKSGNPDHHILFHCSHSHRVSAGKETQHAAKPPLSHGQTRSGKKMYSFVTRFVKI
jgi:hypothetical protein